ncbi:MAG: phosphodiesterase [Clostridia bacterium]|nr:phosphodiesterase [Clostridia bacterium]
MKWLIASDIHGSAVYCEMLIKAFDNEKADRLLLLGDILYHGPRNDLPDGYDPKQVIAMLNGISDSILCVRGNCDTEVDQMVLAFPIMADYALIDIGKTVVYVTHGHTFNRANSPPMKKGDILLHGHTHVPACEAFGDFTYLNPGSVSIPKDGSERGYMTFDGTNFLWKTLEGETYKNFKIE